MTACLGSLPARQREKRAGRFGTLVQSGQSLWALGVRSSAHLDLDNTHAPQLAAAGVVFGSQNERPIESGYDTNWGLSAGSTAYQTYRERFALTSVGFTGNIRNNPGAHKTLV